MGRRFESKRDTWLSAILVSSMVVCAVTMLPLLYYPGWHWAMFAVMVVCVSTIFLLLWVMFGTYYVVGNGVLNIYHGPFRWHIPLRDICNIEPTRSPWSSPALSMDRLRISYDPGKQVLISPERQQEFIMIVRSGRTE